MMRRCNGHKVGRLSVEFKRFTKNNDHWSQNNKNIKYCISTMIAFEAKNVFLLCQRRPNIALQTLVYQFARQITWHVPQINEGWLLLEISHTDISTSLQFAQPVCSHTFSGIQYQCLIEQLGLHTPFQICDPHYRLYNLRFDTVRRFEGRILLLLSSSSSSISEKCHSRPADCTV
jgi:hypothetical protein